MMKNTIIFLFFLSFSSLHSQKIKLDYFDNIYYEEEGSTIILYINDKFIKILEPINLEVYKSCKISIESSKSYINLIYTFQNGNDYKIINNIFKFKEKNFFLTNIFITYSDRYQTSLTGMSCNSIKLEDYLIKSDLFDNKNVEKKISLITGHQEEKEVDEIPYYNLIAKTFHRKKYTNIKLFTNEFVIDELGIEENLNIDEFNNVAFFAYKSKAYNESIYILNKIIEKFPTRVVAYLNIADCYWEINEKEKAKENYKKYIQLMKEQKKDLKRIPKYVFERIK